MIRNCIGVSELHHRIGVIVPPYVPVVPITIFTETCGQFVWRSGWWWGSLVNPISGKLPCCQSVVLVFDGIYHHRRYTKVVNPHVDCHVGGVRLTSIPSISLNFISICPSKSQWNPRENRFTGNGQMFDFQWFTIFCPSSPSKSYKD